MKKVRRSELKPGRTFNTDIILGSESHGSIETKKIEDFDFGPEITVTIGYGTSELHKIKAKKVIVKPAGQTFKFFKSFFGEQSTEETSCHFYNCDIKEIILSGVDNVTVQGSPSAFSLQTTSAKNIILDNNPKLEKISTINVHELVHITNTNNPELVLTEKQQNASDARAKRQQGHKTPVYGL